MGSIHGRLQRSSCGTFATNQQQLARVGDKPVHPTCTYSSSVPRAQIQGEWKNIWTVGLQRGSLPVGTVLSPEFLGKRKHESVEIGGVDRICYPGDRTCPDGEPRRWLGSQGSDRGRGLTLQMGQTILRPSARASSWDPLAFWFFSALRRCASIFCFPRVIPTPPLRYPLSSRWSPPLFRRSDSDRRPPWPSRDRVWLDSSSLPFPCRTFFLPRSAYSSRSVVGYFPIAGRKPATQTIACVHF